ncbi:hypothetical protein BSKO_06827 [Bryopsis sp. KO-2023]|nr:hypothetical protein BSKO_06827 [Bryopsis sp. KO-2023]
MIGSGKISTGLTTSAQLGAAKVPTLRPKRVKRSVTTHFKGNSKAESEELTDFYAILDATRETSAEELKAKYRALQKQYHPDVTGEQDMSAQLNQAYKTLSDPELKESYDRRLSRFRVRHKGELIRTPMEGPGVMGPMHPGEVLSQELVQVPDGADFQREGRKLVVWMREWAKTFVFASDLPLPMPLQCDDIDSGLRLAFIATERNRIMSVGELVFLVVPDEEAQSWAVEVRRISVVRPGPIPGEDRVLQAFKDALRDKASCAAGKKKGGMFELTGLAAAAFAQFMPALVTLPVRRMDGAAYEAYHLKHAEEDFEKGAF